MPGTFNREGAFSIELGTGRENTIHKMLSLNESLYAFSTKKIFRIRTADDIDPERAEPETRHSYQELYPIGCSNSFVARSIIQAEQILDGVFLRPELGKDELLEAVWEATELLLQCENARFRIYSEVVSLLEKIDEVVEESKSQTVIPSLPQVADLDERVGSFLGNAKRFLEKAHVLLSLFYDCPDHRSNFRAYREWMAANRSDSDSVVTLLAGDEEWIRFIAGSRNALSVNHAREGFVLEVQNFKLEPGNKVSPPSWRYDLSGRGGPVQEYWSDIVEEMDTHLHNMLTFFEELYILCVLDNRDQRLPFEFGIYKIPDDEVSEECPVFYVARVTPRSSWLKKDEEARGVFERRFRLAALRISRAERGGHRGSYPATPWPSGSSFSRWRSGSNDIHTVQFNSAGCCLKFPGEMDT